MSLVDANGNPVTPKLDQGQFINMMNGLRIRIDAANAQLVQLGLLVEYLYENLEEKGISVDMDAFPTWAEARYKEIQEQAKSMMESTEEEVQNIKDNISAAVNEVGDAVTGAVDTATPDGEVPVDDTATDVSTATETE